MVYVEKSRVDFRQKRFISKEVSLHAAIKKNYQSFAFVMPNISITKKDENVKDAEGNKNILQALSSYSLSTGKPVDIRHRCIPFLQYLELYSTPMGDTAKSKLKDVLRQEPEDKSKKALEQCTIVNVIVLINAILKKLSAYAEFT